MQGIILIFIGLLMGKTSGMFTKIENGVTTWGKIINLEHTYSTDEQKPSNRAIVEYIVRGKSYIAKTKYQSSSFFVGKKMKVIYSEENPQSAVVKPHNMVYAVVWCLLLSGCFIFLYIFLN